ncbi:MAG: hypothetical protein LC650_03340 [Actinobacteria bacterium]|nr:hypothetical protein [Actinomycetota bacterium]
MKMYQGRAAVIANKLVELSAQDYRRGFNDSVLSECRDALEAFDGSGREFWNQMLTGNREEAFKNFFNNTFSLLDYFDTVEEQSQGAGAFEMPWWGTKGT